MSNAKFKVGDRVRCVSAFGISSARLEHGAEYVVTALDEAEGHETLVYVDAIDCASFESRFESVEPTNPKQHKFKVGDQVQRSAQPDRRAWPLPGKVHVVMDVNASSGWVKVDGLGGIYFEPEQFDLVEAQPPAEREPPRESREVDTRWGTVTVTVYYHRDDGKRCVRFTLNDGDSTTLLGDREFGRSCDVFDPNFVARLVIEHKLRVAGAKPVEHELHTTMRAIQQQLHNQAEAEANKLPGPGTACEWGEP